MLAIDLVCNLYERCLNQLQFNGALDAGFNRSSVNPFLDDKMMKFPPGARPKCEEDEFASILSLSCLRGSVVQDDGDEDFDGVDIDLDDVAMGVDDSSAGLNLGQVMDDTCISVPSSFEVGNDCAPYETKGPLMENTGDGEAEEARDTFGTIISYKK